MKITFFRPDAPLKRPSGIAYDARTGHIFVLNLKANSLVGYKLD